MTQANSSYPLCAITERYPILRRIQPEERPAYVAQVEAAIPLEPEQLTALGYCPDLVGVVLMPASGFRATQAQLDALFPPSRRHRLSDIVELGAEAAYERSA